MTTKTKKANGVVNLYKGDCTCDAFEEKAKQQGSDVMFWSSAGPAHKYDCVLSIRAREERLLSYLSQMSGISSRLETLTSTFHAALIGAAIAILVVGIAIIMLVAMLVE